MSSIQNVNLPALVELLTLADNIRVQGKPRIEIEKISWNSEVPYYIMTAVGKKPELRSVVAEDGTWRFQTPDEKKLDLYSAKQYASVTDAYLDIVNVRPLHPNYKPPVEKVEVV